MAIRALTGATIDSDSRVVVPAGTPNGMTAFSPHDWSNPVGLVSRYAATRSSGRIRGAEQVYGVQGRPTRVLATRHTALGKDVLDAMHLEQFALQTQAFLEVPSAAELRLDSGAQAVWQGPMVCDTDIIQSRNVDQFTCSDLGTRRFFEGARVFLFPTCVPSADLELTGSLVGVNHYTSEIVSVVGDVVTLSSGVPAEVGAGWSICPSIDCLALEQVPEQVISAGIVRMALQATEVSFTSTLPPSILADTDSMPPRWDQHSDGRYIFDVEHNFKSIAASGFRRETSVASSGLGGHASQYGSRAVRFWSLELLALSRQEFWDVLQFWDWHRGSHEAFWFLYPKTLWSEVSAPDVNTLRGHRRGNRIIFKSNVTALAVYNAANEYVVVGTGAVTESSGGEWDVALLDPLPPGFVPLYVRPAAVSKFSTDGLAESWETLEICSLQVEIIEARQEGEVELQP